MASRRKRDYYLVLGITKDASESDVKRALQIAEPELAIGTELFLTSSIREIAPLVRIATTAVGTGRPGAVTQRIVAAYATLARDECGA